MIGGLVAFAASRAGSQIAIGIGVAMLVGGLALWDARRIDQAEQRGAAEVEARAAEIAIEIEGVRRNEDAIAAQLGDAALCARVARAGAVQQCKRLCDFLTADSDREKCVRRVAQAAAGE